MGDVVMTRLVQRSICCPCGNDKVLALGLCATCYTLKRQDEEYFGGHREAVLTRDGKRCAVPGCATLKRGKRSIAVHHRKPGNSDPKLMITLCLACHAKVTRTYISKENGLLCFECYGASSTQKPMSRPPLISRKRERPRSASSSSEMNRNRVEVRDGRFTGSNSSRVRGVELLVVGQVVCDDPIAYA